MPLYKKKGTLEPLKRNIKEEVLFDGECDFGSKSYMVQIYLSLTKKLMIIAHNSGKNENFVIEIENDKVNALVTQFDWDYANIAAHLRILNNRMVLLNPKYLN